MGRWRGYGGPSDFNNTTFESFTWASALGALTKYVTVLATCHVPLVHPLMVAKMASTIDHVTGGRFALNIVCGWFKNEFDMFGAHMRPHDDRYKYATEWLDFLRQAWTRHDEFDFDSESFHAEKVWSQPKPLQKPHPPMMNAGGSPAAQDFTTRYCDMNFVILKDRTYLEGARKQIAHLKNMAREHGRETRIWIHVYVGVPGDRERSEGLSALLRAREGRLGGGRQPAAHLRYAVGDARPHNARRPQGAFHRRPRRLSAGRHRRADRRRDREARRHRRGRVSDCPGSTTRTSSGNGTTRCCR